MHTGYSSCASKENLYLETSTSLMEITPLLVQALLMEEIEDEVPPTTKFSLGYFADGKQTVKKWLVTLKEIYNSGSKELLL